eukprot:8955947-Pyramimonas_sp.AAC.1
MERRTQQQKRTPVSARLPRMQLDASSRPTASPFRFSCSCWRWPITSPRRRAGSTAPRLALQG